MENKNLLSGLVKNQKLLDMYLRYLHFGRVHYTETNITPQVKTEKIRLLETAVRHGYRIENSLIYRLQQEFVRENLSLYLLLEPLATWRYLATQKLPESETQLTDVLGNISSPLARFLMALNDETPSTYFPIQSLITALILLQMFQQKDVFLQKIKWRKNGKVSKLKGLLKDGFTVLSVVKSKKLKYRLAVLLNKAYVLTEKFAKNKQPTIEILDAVRIFLYSTTQVVFIKKRTITKREL